jgi:hypothetical protein
MGIVTAARVAYGDWMLRQPGIDQAQRAGKIDPWSPRSALAEAQAADQESDPGAPAAWRRASELDPHNARILIGAGISAELSGNKELAREYYARAESFSHTWLPRWTLANYYFRQGDSAETLYWLKLAMERSYGDLTAAFDLCEQAGAKEEQILREIVPNTPHPLSQFLHYLGNRSPISQQRAAVMEKTAKQYENAPLTKREPKTGGPLIAATQRLIEAGLAGPARRIWYSGCESKLIACSMPPDDGLISNGKLSVPFLQSGFDWRLFQPPGTTAVQQPGSGTVKINLSGRQPERSEFLAQPIYLPAGKTWRIRLEYQTREMTPRNSGFEWRLDEELLPLQSPLASDDWAEASFVISAVPEDRLSLLLLLYSRKLGTTRSEGELWLRNIRAEPGE